LVRLPSVQQSSFSSLASRALLARKPRMVPVVFSKVFDAFLPAREAARAPVAKRVN